MNKRIIISAILISLLNSNFAIAKEPKNKDLDLKEFIMKHFVNKGYQDPSNPPYKVKKILGVKVKKFETLDNPLGANSRVLIDPELAETPKKDSFKDHIEFIDDYVNINQKKFYWDKRTWNGKKTYRYRINDTFDFKVQRWKPAFEYWIKDDGIRSHSIEFIFYDRGLASEKNGGGPLLNYKIRF